MDDDGTSRRSPVGVLYLVVSGAPAPEGIPALVAACQAAGHRRATGPDQCRMTPFDREAAGQRIARARKRRGLSQAVLTGLVGRSESWLSQVERGKRGVDSHSVLVRLAEVLHVAIHAISASLRLGDPRTATETGEALDTAAMPAGLIGRRTQVNLDLARAYAMCRKDAAAVNLLLAAEGLSP